MKRVKILPAKPRREIEKITNDAIMEIEKDEGIVIDVKISTIYNYGIKCITMITYEI